MPLLASHHFQPHSGCAASSGQPPEHPVEAPDGGGGRGGPGEGGIVCCRGEERPVVRPPVGGGAGLHLIAAGGGGWPGEAAGAFREAGGDAQGGLILAAAVDRAGAKSVFVQIGKTIAVRIPAGSVDAKRVVGFQPVGVFPVIWQAIVIRIRAGIRKGFDEPDIGQGGVRPAEDDPQAVQEFRIAIVEIGQDKGETFSTTIGTPQGDALSPVLFLVYLEHIMRTHENRNLMLQREITFAYADDVNFATIDSDLTCTGLHEGQTNNTRMM